MFISPAAVVPQSCFERGTGEKGGESEPRRGSLPDAELLDERSVTGNVSTSEIVEEPAALADQLHEATTGMVILRMRLEVSSQVVDALGEQRSLHLGRTGVGPVTLVSLPDLSRALLEHCHPALSGSVLLALSFVLRRV
jgi:hypothetical protein